MHRAELLNCAILSLPTTGNATKREFCVAGHLASMLRDIVLTGKEKKYFRLCGTSEVMSHLYRVLTSCENRCLYEHAVYQTALACLWFLCKNEVQTRALLMAADSDVSCLRWMTCLCSVVRTGVTMRKGSVKWTVCVSDALLLMGFMQSVASTEEMMQFAKVIDDENVLPLVFSALLVEKERRKVAEQHRHVEHEAFCRMSALFIQILAFYCSDIVLDCNKSSASDICESLIIDQKMFGFVGRWFCEDESQHLEAVTIVACFVLLTVSFLLGPEVDEQLKQLVLLKLCLVTAQNASNAGIGRHANTLKEILSKQEGPPKHIDEAMIQALLPSPLELLVFFLESDVDEDACCSWCGRSHDGLVMCSQCRAAKYCGPSCQMLHWDRHRIECKRCVS
jgi:hypothetical protein